MAIVRPHFLYPSDPLHPKRPDEIFAAELEAMRDAGFGVSIVSLEDLAMGIFRALPPLPPSLIIYRGWMLSPADYQELIKGMTKAQATPLSDLSAYLSAHHLPNWYPKLIDLTPETRIYPASVDLTAEQQKLGWPQYFIKDYVKSLKTSTGSLVTTRAQAQTVAAKMLHFRGTIEGGYCVRRVEDFLPATERRYFVLNGVPHAFSGPIPAIVMECVKRIQSPFYSVDVIERTDGALRIVEIGDGQVSDLVGWEPKHFASIFL